MIIIMEHGEQCVMMVGILMMPESSVDSWVKGYGGATRSLQGNYVQNGNGSIFLDNVGCNGSESSISDCQHLGWGIHNCAHSEDAGVDCLVSGKLS